MLRMESRSFMLYWLYFAFGITIKQVQGILDLSIPTYAVEYQRYHISIFKETSGTSEPTFYYTPACILHPDGTNVTASPQYLTIKIGLWDEEYTQHIRSYLTKTDGIPNPRIRPVPFKWMRIDTIDNWQISQLGVKWKSIANHPQVISFRIRCWTDSSCEKMAESLAVDSEHFASNIHLSFSSRPPNTTRSTITIQTDHLQASPALQAISGRYPEASFVYLQKSDFGEVVQEVLKESLMSSFNEDEFVYDEQLDGLVREYSRELRYNITSTGQFTQSMWNVTFWSDESQRPDVRAKDLEALFGNGKNWLKRVMRGENVTSETGISESSPSVAEAIAELRAGKGHVQWSGSDIIIKPFKLWCVAMGALRGETNFGASSVWVTKRRADYLTSAHFVTGNSATTQSVTVESRTDVRHYNNSFGKVFQMIANLTDIHKSRCHSLEPKRNATWLMRDAENSWSLNYTLIAATVRYVGRLELLSDCEAQGFTGTTNSFGEISLFLPKRPDYELAVTFEVAGYYPITLRNVQLDGNAVTTFMEPLLFISRRFTGSGTVTGKLHDFSSFATLQGVKLDFRSEMNTHNGIVVESVTTAADGTWSVTIPGGQYTVTASKNGYITLPFTVVVVGGKNKQFGVSGLSPTNGTTSGVIRIVSLGGVPSRSFFLPVHVRGPLEGKSERAHTHHDSGSIPSSFVKYEIKQYDIQSALIEKQLAGIYRISVSDHQSIQKSRTGTLWDMANSCGTVQLYTGHKLWAQYFIPNRPGNAWSVVEINGTQLKTINEVATVARMEDVN